MSALPDSIYWWIAGALLLFWFVGANNRLMRLRSAALVAYAVYAPEVRHPVEVAATQQEHLVQWLSKRLGRPLKVPDLTFHDAEGKQRKLSEFRGHPILVNLWATWCVPCRKEMPALDELQGKLGGDKFNVIAINIDTRDPEKPKNFLTEEKLTRLAYFTDASAKVFQELKNVGKALGMPTSMLIDGAGCEIATIAGPAEWASDDAVNLIKAAIAK